MSYFFKYGGYEPLQNFYEHLMTGIVDQTLNHVW